MQRAMFTALILGEHGHVLLGSPGQQIFTARTPASTLFSGQVPCRPNTSHPMRNLFRRFRCTPERSKQ